MLCVAICIGLYGAVEIDHWWQGQPQRDSIHALGGISHAYIDDPRANLSPGPLGLVDVWNGEVWRIWVTGFHHAGFMHLFFNVLSMLVLGVLLEPRIGSFALAMMIAI
jgi:membrane associated rhomboid family serine protease